MKRPIIAMSSKIGEGGMISIRDTYLNAVWHAGGLPFVLSPSVREKYLAEVCRVSDGFIFCGGEDIDPKYYGEAVNNINPNISSLRDEFEYRLFIAAIKTNKPILGICRGMQIINVFLGGSLYQHIEGHMQGKPRDLATHSLEIKNKSLLFNIIQRGAIGVNSFHHQAIKRLSDRLVIDAISDDGYIEAFHCPDHRFLLGIQWHPEACFSFDAASEQIFKKFTDACI